MSQRPHALALVGPTASGKTAAALALAHALAPLGGAEIISMDSALVYRGMDIGTAKPTASERAQVPHHLIDTTDPLHSFSAAQFAQEAATLMAQIAQRGRIPLLVGGTMLYFKALHDGLDPLPAANAEVRAQLAQQAQALGWAALHSQLAAIDPQAAQRIAPADSQRIGRALEVWMLTGQSLTSLQRTSHSRAQAQWRIPVFSLEPTDRAWLHARIAQRLAAMMEAGFLDEVRALQGRGDLHPDLPSMRCVGYRQAWQGLDEGWSPTDMAQRSVFATRQLAKRQLTWLRSLPQRHVVDAQAPHAVSEWVQRAVALWSQTSA